MKFRILSILALALAATACTPAQKEAADADIYTVPTDSIWLSDPFVLADSATHTYYMTGTGGRLYTSKDMKMWTEPKAVAVTDSDSWMGKRPQIWAAEIHPRDGRYYYFATFTNNKISIDTVRHLPRRASHVLASDSPEGPYTAYGDSTFLPADMLTLDATLWVDTDGKPYMVYCNEWLQNNDGTIEYVEMKPDLSGTVGDATIMFRSSSSPWSHEVVDGKEQPNRVTDGPYLFRTGTGRLGIIWTSWIDKVYTQGVAYSESGTLKGPWVHEAEPITPPDFGHGMLFQDFDGQWIMSVHSHREEANGRYHRVPHFFNVDLSGDKLQILGER